MLWSVNTAWTQSSPCQHPNFRAFDFWIGHWQVGNDTSVAGYNRVDVILDSCVLLENWTGVGPSKGKSFNHYDYASGMWKQKWVDNFGTNLEFTGTVRNDSMIYEATSISRQSGDSILNRMIIAKIDHDHVKQHWAQSNDGGSNWRIAFDAIYTRVDDRISPTADEEAVRHTMKAMYSAISFDENHPFSRQRFLGVFLDDATLLNVSRGGQPQSPSIFVGGLEQMQQNQVSFFERDGPAEVHIFGKVAQYRGYYLASHDEAGDQVISEGVNLAQLVKTADGSWKIISIIWDEDKERKAFRTGF